MFIGKSNAHLVKRIDKDGHRSIYTEEEARQRKQESNKRAHLKHKLKGNSDEQRERRRLWQLKRREELRKKRTEERLAQGLELDGQGRIKKPKIIKPKPQKIVKQKIKKEIIHKSQKCTVTRIIKKEVILTDIQNDQIKKYGHILITTPDSTGFIEYKRFYKCDRNCYNCIHRHIKIDMNTMKTEYYCSKKDRKVYPFSTCDDWKKGI